MKKQKADMPRYGVERENALRETLEMYEETGSINEVARRMKLSRHAIQHRMQRARGEGIMPRRLQEYGDIDIPNAWPEPSNSFCIEGVERLGVIADVHIPFHDKAALTIALSDMRSAGCDGLIINGDFWDCVSASRWEPIPAHRDLNAERRVVVSVLEAIRKAFPTMKIYYRSGNHEYRLIDYLSRKSPEMYNLPEVRLEELMGLAGLGIKWLDEHVKLTYDNLHLMHGDELRIGYGVVNPSKVVLDRTRRNTLSSHCHRSTEHSHRDIEEKVTGSWTTGCLCQMHPYYSRVNQWNHGYAIIDCSDGDGFRVINRRIINGRSY